MKRIGKVKQKRRKDEQMKEKIIFTFTIKKINTTISF
jgi:hypothetical protein